MHCANFRQNRTTTSCPIPVFRSATKSNFLDRRSDQRRTIELTLIKRLVNDKFQLEYRMMEEDDRQLMSLCQDTTSIKRKT